MAKSRVIMELSGEEAKLVRTYQNAIRENQKLKDELRDLSRTGRASTNWADGAGKSIKAAFSPANIAGFAAALTGVGGITAGFSQIVSLARESREEIKGFANELRESYDAGRDLWQISKGAQGYANLRADQRLAMAREGIGRQEAGALLFNLQSLGKGEHLDEIAQAGRFMDPFTASKYFTTIDSPLNFGSDDKTPEQILSGLIAGAGASKFNTGETADWVLRIAPIMADFGASQAELLAIGASISEAAEAPEILATYLRAGHKDLNKWRQESIAAGEKEAAPKPEAPEKPAAPAYEPPEFKERLYSSSSSLINAKLAHKEAVAAYEKRHAKKQEEHQEDLADYQKDFAKYQKDLAAWETEETQRKRSAAAAEAADGFLETFQAMRTSDPEAYHAARLANVRFNNIAAALEKGLPEAQALTPQIQAAIDEGTLYGEKVAARPRHLEEQHGLRVAEAQKEIGYEAEAEAQNRLSTVINQTKAVQALTGDRLTAAGMVKTEGWEKLLQAGATVAGADAATLEATEKLFETMARFHPGLYQEHLGQFAPVDYTTTSRGRMVPKAVNIDFDAVTPDMTAALQAAVLALAEGRIGRDKAAEIDEANLRYPPTGANTVDVTPAGAEAVDRNTDHLGDLSASLDNLNRTLTEGAITNPLLGGQAPATVPSPSGRYLFEGEPANG